MEDNLDNIIRMLTIERDRKLFDVRAEEENNINREHEVREMRMLLMDTIVEPRMLREKIAPKVRRLGKISEELRSILGSYLSHLFEIILRLRRDCQVDLRLMLSGEFESYDGFLQRYVQHRKDYHLYKIKAKRLASDLKLLDEMPSLAMNKLIVDENNNIDEL